MRGVPLALLLGGLLLLGACASPAGRASASPAPSTPTGGASKATAVPAGCGNAEPSDQDLEIASTVYGSVDRVRVHLTPCARASADPLPVLYLLHGMGHDESHWIEVGAPDAADQAVLGGTFPPAVIVIPDAAPAYSCIDCGQELATHLLDEIEPQLSAIARVDPARRAIGGISYGGGLALGVAGARPDAFVAVGGHSPVEAPEEALVVLAVKHVPVYLDAGADDSLLDGTEEMAGILDAHCGDFTFTVNDGAHEEPYWRIHTPQYLEFYGFHLKPGGSS